MSWYAMDCILKDVFELPNPKLPSVQHPRFDTFLAILILHTMEFERKLAVWVYNWSGLKLDAGS
ncbi:hypothetical protein [Pseudomonas fluorescens]|uniref:hypothetical protein n=1 Tax=Pseudomonas fluorescens TaxID=294 RepID=UPI001FD18C72|nr:hypothetical protein [Pseudomonas fluorescens]